MVCGLTTNYPDTSWDETEACSIKHFFILAQKILNWVLFSFSLLMLPVAVLITGGIFYFAEDKSKVIPEIKKSWRWVGIGYGFLFFSWFLTTLLMQILGYQKNWSFFSV
jgi:hypothetical protein